ncbi:MAG: PleD family two-component system response regulator [Nitrospinaceae bacterium]
MTARILVADDSITIQKIVSMAFENEDAIVEGIGNGQGAFDKLGDFQPDIVLADVDMPGLNGFDLSRKIKSSPDFSSISVLLLASDFEDFNEDQFRKSGADDHITKPFKSEDIVRRVKDLLASPGTPPAPAEEEEEVISLSEADMVDEEDERVIDLTDEDFLEGAGDSLPDKEEDFLLEFSTDDLDLKYESPQAPPEIGTPVPVGEEEPPTEPLPEEELVPAEGEGSPEELLHKVEELSHLTEKIKSPEWTEKPSTSEAIDQVIHDMKALKEMSSQPAAGESSLEEDKEIVAEVGSHPEDEPQELEAAFHEIVQEGPGSANAAEKFASNDEEKTDEVDSITPEPEDLLGDLAHHHFQPVSQGGAPAMIQETRSIATENSGKNQNAQPGPSSLEAPGENSEGPQEISEDRLVHLVGEEVKRILAQSLDSSIEKEMAGLSQTILQAVKEMVREVTPGIVREVIQEEIDRIRKMEES